MERGRATPRPTGPAPAAQPEETAHAPPPPPPRPAPVSCALSPQRWRVNLGASHGEGVYKRKHRPWWPVFPCSPCQQADRQPGRTSPALGRGGRQSDGAAVPPPPCTSVGDPAVPLSAPCPRARQSAIRRCLCPPPAPVHVSRRSGCATVRLLPLCTSVGDPTVPHPTQPPPPLSRPRTRRLGPPGTRNTLHNAQPHPRDWIHSRRHP